jgi:DNA-binding Lrp family transcriptional regulator
VLDHIDHEILELLRQDARTTNNEIATKVNLTEGAIRNRVKNLMASGVINRFTVDTTADQVEAIVLIKTQTKASKETLKKIRKFATRLFETAGEYDIATYLGAESVEDINETVDNIRGVTGVISTLTLLKIADDKSSEL